MKELKNKSFGEKDWMIEDNILSFGERTEWRKHRLINSLLDVMVMCRKYPAGTALDHMGIDKSELARLKSSDFRKHYHWELDKEAVRKANEKYKNKK